MYSSVCNLLSMVHYSAVSSAESKHKSGWASQRGAFYTDCQDTTLLATIYKERRGGPALELTLSQMIEPKLKFFFWDFDPCKYQYYTVYEHFLPKIYVLTSSLVFTVVNQSCCTMYTRLDVSPAKKLKMDLNTKCPKFDSNTKFDYSDNQIPRMPCIWTKFVQKFR